MEAEFYKDGKGIVYVNQFGDMVEYIRGYSSGHFEAYWLGPPSKRIGVITPIGGKRWIAKMRGVKCKWTHHYS